MKSNVVEKNSELKAFSAFEKNLMEEGYQQCKQNVLGLIEKLKAQLGTWVAHGEVLLKIESEVKKL